MKRVVFSNFNGYSEGNSNYYRRGHEVTWIVGEGLHAQYVDSRGTNYFSYEHCLETDERFKSRLEGYILLHLSPSERKELDEFLSSSDKKDLFFIKDEWEYNEEEDEQEYDE